ncbi:hypothetical protein OBBRIDRAFT_742499, partial [Obba rivulosa]
GWTLFLSTCIISIVLSAENIILLSALQTRRVIPHSTKMPTVYMGLEALRSQNSSMCRSRSTFAKSFSVFHADDVSGKQRVHVPDDRTTLSFGGEVSAFVNFYIPNYGLENCNLTAKRVASLANPAVKPDANIEVWLLSNEAISDGGIIFLDTLYFSYNLEFTTKPFFCSSCSHMFFQRRCPAEGCKVQIPLEGVTAMSVFHFTLILCISCVRTF